jgi:hypothetical protein
LLNPGNCNGACPEPTLAVVPAEVPFEGSPYIIKVPSRGQSPRLCFGRAGLICGPLPNLSLQQIHWLPHIVNTKVAGE